MHSALKAEPELALVAADHVGTAGNSFGLLAEALPGQVTTALPNLEVPGKRSAHVAPIRQTQVEAVVGRHLPLSSETRRQSPSSGVCKSLEATVGPNTSR